MKLLIIISLAALSLASPLDNKTPLVSANDKNPKLTGRDPIPLEKAPLSPSTVDLHPLHKRESQKSQTAPAVSQNAKPAVAPVPTVQKDATKPVDVNRKTRDTAQKTAPTAAPSNAQKSSNQPASQPQTSNKKTRETQKQGDAWKAPATNVQKNEKVTPSAPQVARAPVTSTNSRSRRDAPKAADQATKTTEVNSKADKAKTSDVPASSNTKPKRDTPAENAQPQNNNNNNQGVVNVRRPAPVDQILKQKAPATTNATPKLAEQS